jgi:cell division protein FtsW (lipid II flippase)
MKAARIARIDGWTVALALALWAIGLVFLSSIHLRGAAELAVNQGPLEVLQSLTKLLGGHLLGIGLGIAAMILVALTPSLWHRRLAWTGILASIGAIALVFTSFGVEQGGARRAIKVIGPQIQPAEFAKAAAIVFIATMLTHHFSGRKGTRLTAEAKAPLIAMIVVVLTACGLVAVQPDLDYALVIGPAMLVMMAAAGMSKKWTAGILGLVLLFGAVAIVKEPFRGQRLWAFTSAVVLGQTPNPNDSGVLEQAQKSADAMAHGGLTGVGLWKGEMMRRVDSVENDFISAAIGEETGLVGQLLVTSLLAALALRLIWLARRAPVYGRLILTGTATWIALQSGINLAMASAALPVLGRLIQHGFGARFGSRICGAGRCLSTLAQRRQAAGRPGLPASRQEEAPRRREARQGLAHGQARPEESQRASGQPPIHRSANHGGLACASC